jgi:hypothetical protein
MDLVILDLVISLVASRSEESLRSRDSLLEDRRLITRRRSGVAALDEAPFV